MADPLHEIITAPGFPTGRGRSQAPPTGSQPPAAAAKAGLPATICQLVLIAMAVVLSGCPAPPAQPPASRREALERVNDNLTRLNRPLQCSALVSFKFRDADGKLHSFLGHEAGLVFMPPQSLRFDVRSLAGSVAQFGSNEAQYWLWVDVPDARKLWWGSWHRVGQPTSRRLPVPPNELLDALMLRPLPESLDGGQLPLLRVDGQDHRLVYVRLGSGGQPVGWREIRLDPRPPYQPIEVMDRLPDGQLVLHAQLSDYRMVGADGPLTPRRYVICWPDSQAELRLDILWARLRPDLGQDLFEFPAGWRGESEEIDAPQPSGLQP